LRDHRRRQARVWEVKKYPGEVNACAIAQLERYVRLYWKARGNNRFRGRTRKGFPVPIVRLAPYWRPRLGAAFVWSHYYVNSRYKGIEAYNTIGNIPGIRGFTLREMEAILAALVLGKIAIDVVRPGPRPNPPPPRPDPVPVPGYNPPKTRLCPTFEWGRIVLRPCR
jgi:hypothetical protein